MIYKVIVDVSNDNVDRIFDYQYDDALPIGSRVLVPFANRQIQGTIVDKSDHTDCPDKIKNITRVLDPSLTISEEFLFVAGVMADKYFLRKNDIFKLILPSQLRDESVSDKYKQTVVPSTLSLADALALVKSARKQAELVSYIYDTGEKDLADLLKFFSRPVVNEAVKKGALNYKKVVESRLNFSTAIKPCDITLTPEQQYAYDAIISAPKTYLLHGITGSGKTEVYLHVIDHALKQGKTAIMLVPEISLTPLMMKRFAERFGDQIAVLHSRLSAGEKYEQWKRLKEGKAKVALGARSAIFAPLDNLGAIIIDEEHDGSYTSENNPRFETSFVAELRAKYNHCPLVLGSATPKIEDYYKAKQGEYTLLTLTKRTNNATLPDFEIVDMVGQAMDGNTSCFSNELLSAIKQNVEKGKQTMLFVNRRGWASFMMCRDCGYIAKCKDCDIALVYHKDEEQLKCHYCGKRYYALTECPNCHSHYIRYGATGTQRIVEELQNIFPDLPIFRMDNDTTRGKDSHEKILSAFGATSPAVLVGTQMIAKGHDFEGVNLVGIIDADVSLFTNDYRATENTFQLVTQVAGRAGRKSNDGKVILQTYAPKHYVYRLARTYDYEHFYEHEINVRQTTQFPPFSNIVRVLVTSENELLAQKTVKSLITPLMSLKTNFPREIYNLQAMPSPIKRIQNKFRYQIIIRYALNENITCKIYNICDIMPKGKVSIFIENNPKNIR